MNKLIRVFLVVIAGLAATSIGVRNGEGQPASATFRPERVTVPGEPDSLRREVMENLLNLPAGPGLVADFNTPLDFVGRAADRILTAAFEEQFRKVVADGTRTPPSRATSRPTSGPAGESGIRVIQTHVTPERLALWRTWREDYPAHRAFRAPTTLPGAPSVVPPAAGVAIAVPFRQTLPGWRVCTESGESEIEGLHLQLSRGDDWLAPGDGGCIDVARELAAAMPTARIVASIEQKHLPDFLIEAVEWKSQRSGEILALVSPLPVAQWAQDNCKFGWVEGEKGEPRGRVALVPRYPSRGEAGAVFIPGEAVVLQGLAECGVARVVQSSMLFQAGNLICVWDAAKKQRVLLIGEGEIFRNVALGLTQSQVLEAFKIEFGVDKCVVLPAASFHIDYEVSVRNVNERTIALVNDEQAAAEQVLWCGINVLARAGELTGEQASRALRSINEGTPELAEVLGAVLTRASRGSGGFAQSFAEKFSTGSADSGVGNFQCFLRAFDSWRLSRPELQPDPKDAATRASFDALRRREADRKALHGILKSLGWEVVPIPSMGDSKRAFNYLNGIHDKTRFFMPTYEGTFEKVDQAAQAAVRKAFGPSVEIVPIRCAESQRREGAVRCSAAVMYAPPSAPR